MSEELERAARREPTVIGDPWEKLRRYTPARIALGRAGGSVPTRELLAFQLAHARARDAVHEVFDAEAICGELGALGLRAVKLATCASDRVEYLKDPDRGRRLSDESRAALTEAARGEKADVAIIVADGLSALAVKAQAMGVIKALMPRMVRHGWTVGPVGVVTFARVAVEDEIGELLGAQVAVILIGERPGLGTADSLGAYLVYGPRRGRSDAERNCISNIRAGGLSHAQAAEGIEGMVGEMMRKRVSGVGLRGVGVLDQ